LSNIVTVVAESDTVVLPEAALDLIFTRNVFHHLTDPEPYFRSRNPAIGQECPGTAAEATNQPECPSCPSTTRTYLPDRNVYRKYASAFSLMNTVKIAPPGLLAPSAFNR
jgi:hypothetical protein